MHRGSVQRMIGVWSQVGFVMVIHNVMMDGMSRLSSALKTSAKKNWDGGSVQMRHFAWTRMTFVMGRRNAKMNIRMYVMLIIAGHAQLKRGQMHLVLSIK